MKYLLLYLEETYGLTNEKKIDNAIGIVANENKYHPIRDYLSALVWDGTERIRFCLRHFLGADADDYTYEALKLFLLGAISRAFQPGCKFEIMLCLVGGQGAGKSTFFRLLAVRDEWFSDDLRKLDDDNVYRKLQGHWIIEMSEMMATANAKSIEEIKSFLSRQKEVYKIPYETHPADRPRQCVFGGTSNALDFLPLDRSGNRRFIPVMVYPEQAEVHILEDEAASRAYIGQMWAEAMEIYRSGRFKLAFSPAMQRYLKEHQRDFMPEDTKAGMIQAYLDKYTGSMVCSKQLYISGEKPIDVQRSAQQQESAVPDGHLTGERVSTPRGSFHIANMTREQMEAAGYGYHHSTDDGKYLIMGNGTQAFAIAAEQREQENYMRTAELSTEQNYNMIDGQINNTPSVDELEEKAKRGEVISLSALAAAVKAEDGRTPQRDPDGKKPSIRAQLKADRAQSCKPQQREKEQEAKRSIRQALEME